MDALGIKIILFCFNPPPVFLAMTPNPVQSSAAWGFFPQTLGTAFLLFSLAILSKILSQTNFSLKATLWWGISWAAIVSIYSELFPVLGLASLFSFLFMIQRFYKKGRLLNLFKTIFIAFGSGLLCANYEWIRMFKAIPLQMKSAVGWFIQMDYFNLWGDAIGAKPVNVVWSIGFLLLSIGLTILWLMGLLVLFRKKQFIPLSILGVWLAMVFYFWLTKETDPSRAAWSIYKITQWSALSLLAMAFFSLRIFKFLNIKLLALAVALVCIAGFIPLVSVFNFHGEAMREATGTENPIEDYFQLAQITKEYKKTNLYQVSPSPQWPRMLPSYFLMDRPLFMGSWDGEPASGSDQVGSLKNSETLYYCLACPFSNSRNALLPANSVVIQQPVISDLNKSDFDIQRNKKLVFQVLESEKVCLTIFSMRAGKTDVSIQSDPARLQISNETDWKIEIINDDGNTKPKIEFPTQKGYNHLCIRSNSAASVTILDLYLPDN